MTVVDDHFVGKSGVLGCVGDIDPWGVDYGSLSEDIRDAVRTLIVDQEWPTGTVDMSEIISGLGIDDCVT
ncbi:MAG: hypothetical protein U5K37_08650 [Natrialbaceae archaeon]|nr:hypothetical protein [Natrialbaceae archaeon]